MKQRVLLTTHDKRKVLFVIHFCSTLTNTNFDLDTSSAKIAENYFSGTKKHFDSRVFMITELP